MSEKCQKFEKIQLRGDDDIIEKMSGKYTNFEVSVSNFKARCRSF